MDTLPPILWAEQFFATFAEAAKPVKRTHEECPAYQESSPGLAHKAIIPDTSRHRKCAQVHIFRT